MEGLFSEFYVLCFKQFEKKKSLAILKSAFFVKKTCVFTPKTVPFKAEIGRF